MNLSRWAQVAAERFGLAVLPPQHWDCPSRCQGWKVRGVLGHLVHPAESGIRSRLADRRGPDGRDPALELGSPVPELCRRLQAAAASRCGGMPAVALCEAVTHGDDMLRPLGQPMDVQPGVAIAVLAQLRRVDRIAARWAFGGTAPRGVRLAATDVDWAWAQALACKVQPWTWRPCSPTGPAR